MKRLAIVMVMFLASCGGGGDAPDSGAQPSSTSPSPAGHAFTMEVTLGWFSGAYLTAAGDGSAGVPCHSADFTKALQVSDGSHEILAVGSFPAAGVWTGPDEGNGACTWSTTVQIPDVPIYIVKSGLGTKTYSNEQLSTEGWKLTVNHS